MLRGLEHAEAETLAESLERSRETPRKPSVEVVLDAGQFDRDIPELAGEGFVVR
jgi:hypothetical protein